MDQHNENTDPRQPVADLNEAELARPEGPPPSKAGGEGDGAAAAESPLRTAVIDQIRTVFDPEIPVNIYDLGLIYTVTVKEDSTVDVEMTLTSPACPVAGTLPPEVADKIRAVDGVADANVEVVWDPPWNPGMMSDEAQLELGFM